MYELTLKRRIAIFCGFLFLFIPLIYGGAYITTDGLMLYFSFPDSFIFSSFVIYGVALSLILLPLSLLSFYPVFLGRLAHISIQKKVGMFIFICFSFFITLQIGFGIYFSSELERRGYIACRGIPSGWMPGMATRYALNETLCKKKTNTDNSPYLP